MEESNRNYRPIALGSNIYAPDEITKILPSALKPLYDLKKGPMGVIGFMSSNGADLVNLLKHEMYLKETSNTKNGNSPFSVVAIFSDKSEGDAYSIGEMFGIPVVVKDFQKFCKSIDGSPDDLEVREEFDSEIVNMLSEYDAYVAAHVGYKNKITDILASSFMNVMTSPGNASIHGDFGERRYLGNDSVKKALLDGEKYLHTSAYFVEKNVSDIRMLMVSPPLKVSIEYSTIKKFSENVIEETAKEYRLKLKEKNQELLPKTIELIAKGFFAQDKFGSVYFVKKGDSPKIITNGLRMREKKSPLNHYA